MKNGLKRLITAAGITILVGIFCYPVAYGTNELSYRWGYSAGRSGYDCGKGYNLLGRTEKQGQAEAENNRQIGCMTNWKMLMVLLTKKIMRKMSGRYYRI
jgi:hypothetical protein